MIIVNNELIISRICNTLALQKQHQQQQNEIMYIYIYVHPYTRTSCMGILNLRFSRNCDADSMMAVVVIDKFFLIFFCTYAKLFLFGSFKRSCVRIAVRSLTKDAAQTVVNPNKVGIILFPVEIPTTFCTAVDKARVVPNATHPPTIGSIESGMFLKYLYGVVSSLYLPVIVEYFESNLCTWMHTADHDCYRFLNFKLSHH
jgi:hypothetical protein